MSNSGTQLIVILSRIEGGIVMTWQVEQDPKLVIWAKILNMCLSKLLRIYGYQLINQYRTDSNRSVRIKKLENVIITVFNCHYKGRLFKWVQDYEDAYTELVYWAKLLGQ
jgi:hypothetical protein